MADFHSHTTARMQKPSGGSGQVGADMQGSEGTAQPHRITIALLNHATGTGHHEPWLALTAAELLKRGHRVVCLTPSPERFCAALAQFDMDQHPDLNVVACTELEPPGLSLWQRARGGLIALGYAVISRIRRDKERKHFLQVIRERWHVMGPLYAARVPELRTSKDVPLAVRIKRRVLLLVVPPIWRWFSKRSAARSLHTGLLAPARLAAAARHLPQTAPWQSELLICMYADLWLTDPKHWSKAQPVPVAWGGIRFRPFEPAMAGSEGYFADRNFRGMCFLDEEAVDVYNRRCPAHAFTFLPDVAVGLLPEVPPAVVEEMRHAARGRQIVLLCGSIEGRKNISLFCDMARHANPKAYLFAIVGQFHATTLSRAEAAQLAAFRSNSDNCFFKDLYFEDERDMNALIADANIIFAAYRKFPISSNMLGKAAMFRKSILVSEGYLMGRRVGRYGIGALIPEESAAAACQALDRIAADPPSEAAFRRFCSDFNSDAFGDGIAAFVAACRHGATQ